MENKDIHMIMLEILKWIDEISRKEGFSYMLTQGTLLGAVREKGFIEWDIEDGDIMMHRKDFNLFLDHYKKHTEDMEFCLGYEEDGLVPRLTFKSNPEIFIEIVLIDFLSRAKWKRKWKIILLRLINAMMRTHNCYKNNHSLAHNVRTWLIWCFGRLFRQNTKRSIYHKVSQLASENGSTLVHFSNEYLTKMIFEFDRELLQETIRIPFEDTELSAPKEWDTVLRFYYGDDYMIPKRADYKMDLVSL